MSVIFDQLRISDNGQSLYLDAHVNEASYFDNVYMGKVTVCTEDQVSETHPESYTDFIYQQTIEPLSTIEAIYDKVQILSENNLIDALGSKGEIVLSTNRASSAITHYMSLVLSGKFSVFDTNFVPLLVVATTTFDPTADSLNSDKILFTISGTPFSDKGHRVWQFKGKGEIKNFSPVKLFLYRQVSSGDYEFTSVNATDDVNFLHLLYQVYGEKANNNKKELHTILSKASFDAAFNNTTFDESGNPHPIVSGKPIASKAFSANDLSHNMFFVYIETVGEPSSDTPCTLDETTTLGVTFDYGILYNRAMNYTRELADNCSIPHGFIDFILNTEALKLSLETEHYVPAIGYWRWLMGGSFRGATGYNVTKPCGCHG